MNVDEALHRLNYAVGVANRILPLDRARENDSALTVAKIAMGKQKGKTAEMVNESVYKCPYCGMENILEYCPRYCGHCGQAVDLREAINGKEEA